MLRYNHIFTLVATLGVGALFMRAMGWMGSLETIDSWSGCVIGMLVYHAAVKILEKK